MEAKSEASNDVNVSLSKFVFERQLGICPFTKKIFILGNFPDSDNSAIVILEKTPFTESDFPDIFEESCGPELYFKNDIYYSFCHYPKLKFSGLKTTLIYPATEQLITKYTPESNVIFEETFELHEKITKPYVLEKYGDPEWVYNILDHKAETERIIFEDTDPTQGFILIPDLKWDGIKLEGLYIQAFPFDRKLRTIRDLEGRHLPLLRNIAKNGIQVIYDKFKVKKSQLLIYLHYLPSFYHLHVHFKLNNAEGNSGTSCDRAHLLKTVIQNIELCPNYYQKVDLTVSLRKSDVLLEKLQNAV